jgi:hypothetical protein
LGENYFFQDVDTFDEIDTDHGVEESDNEVGRRRGSSGQTQCGNPEVTPPCEKEKSNGRTKLQK